MLIRWCCGGRLGHSVEPPSRQLARRWVALFPLTFGACVLCSYGRPVSVPFSSRSSSCAKGVCMLIRWCCGGRHSMEPPSRQLARRWVALSPLTFGACVFVWAGRFCSVFFTQFFRCQRGVHAHSVVLRWQAGAQCGAAVTSTSAQVGRASPPDLLRIFVVFVWAARFRSVFFTQFFRCQRGVHAHSVVLRWQAGAQCGAAVTSTSAQVGRAFHHVTSTSAQVGRAFQPVSFVCGWAALFILFF